MDQATPQATNATILPTLGSPLHGGLYAGITTNKDGSAYALILLPDEPSEALPWSKALDWAYSLGDDADLPTRPEAALLFANLPGQFRQTWHWTNEQPASYSDYAWYQDFIYGTQNFSLKSAELRARAVRRLPIQSLTI
jgi:hypothetical protein